MSKIENSEITYLSLEMQMLARKEGRGEITKEEYQTKFDELELKRKEVTQKVIDEQLALRKVKDEEEDKDRRNNKMAEEKVKKEKVSKVRGPKKDSYASVILETLQKKSIKNVDAATDAVMEKKPGRERAKVRAQIVVMINEVKNGKKPAYTWDEATFQLNLKA
jgi:hypothetical protein